jgi:uncharacterized protein with HEPN domain
MPKDSSVYVQHMLDHAREAVSLLAGRDLAAFSTDRALRLALAHLVQVIGEAARLIPASVRELAPSLPWPQIVGMRHKIVHEYMNIDEDLVWSVVHNDLPVLIRELERVLAQLQIDQ